VEISQPVLVSLLALLAAMPIGIWVSRRTGDVLHRHDAALDRIDFDRVAACVPAFDVGDPLQQIEALTDQEVVLIREILEERSAGGHVTSEHVDALRTVHRRGLALRQRCGDLALEGEVGWLQAYGSLALMADLSELDRAKFEIELAFRADEVRRAVELRRSRISHHHAGAHAPGRTR
jgi:hypothetical protein